MEKRESVRNNDLKIIEIKNRDLVEIDTIEKEVFLKLCDFFIDKINSDEDEEISDCYFLHDIFEVNLFDCKNQDKFDDKIFKSYVEEVFDGEFWVEYSEYRTVIEIDFRLFAPKYIDVSKINTMSKVIKRLKKQQMEIISGDEEPNEDQIFIFNEIQENINSLTDENYDFMKMIHSEDEWDDLGKYDQIF
jgi:hypothetical protein